MSTTTEPTMYLSCDATKSEIVGATPAYLSRDARHSLIWAAAHTGQHRIDCIERANREERNHRLREGIERHPCIEPGCEWEQEIAGRCLPCAKAHAS